VWRFAPPAADRPKRVRREVLATLSTSAASIALAKDLKRRG
jgi:DNA-3-methyladenine glycosylase I